MSKSVGIVAEYNPFHTGHRYQTDCLRKAGYENIAVAMSGSCVQRGQFAFMDKFSRRKMALENGVSLVAEIPCPFSIRSAEGFAAAGMQTLKAMGVNAVSFGSESGDISLLKNIAEYLLSREYEQLLAGYLAEGNNFASAREKAIFHRFDISKEVVSASNDILAIEYLKACIRLEWEPEFAVIRRVGAAYNRPAAKDGYASASGIRQMIAEYRQDSAGKFIPAESSGTFYKNLDRGNFFVPDTAYEKTVLFTLRQKTAKDFALLPDCNEELANAFEKAVASSHSLESMYDSLPTRRYTRARLNRIILCALLGIEKDMPRDIQYVRVLGFDSGAEEFMKKTAASCSLPFSHSAKILGEKGRPCRKIAETESKAMDAQSALFRISRPRRLDYTSRIVKI